VIETHGGGQSNRHGRLDRFARTAVAVFEFRPLYLYCTALKEA
jgi:hypothetical protein